MPIGFHFQGNADDWPEAVAKLPAGAPVKFVDGVQRAVEAKQVNPNVHVNIRHHVHEQNPTGDMHQQARDFFTSFVDESFRQISWAVDSVGEYNEYFADSQSNEEKARWISWIQACADVWRDEYRTQSEYAHIDLALAATAVGNNIPLEVAKIAHENPFCILDYHCYWPVHKKRMSPEGWEWYAGRFESMDMIYRYNGYHVRWFFGEFGAVGINGEPDPDGVWPNSLAANDGWRHPDVYDGDVDGYLDMMTVWCSWLEDTQAWKDGRVIGATIFTSGGGSLWKHFEVKQPEMNAIAAHVKMLRRNMAEPGDLDPVDPPPPPPAGDCTPREEYSRFSIVVPQDVTREQYYQACEKGFNGKRTVTFSYDDAGLGAAVLTKNEAELWGIAPDLQETYQTWYDRWYPGTSVTFRDFAPLPAAPGVIVDVSSHQGEIDWQQMKTAGVTHAYLRATIGVDRVDGQFHRNVAEAAKHGILWGAYHYYQNHQNGASQAAHYLHTNSYHADLPPALDIEGTLQSAPPTPDHWHDWLEIVEDAISVMPVIYTSAGYWIRAAPIAWARNYPLWVANWTQAPEPTIPADWDTWWLWQYGQDYGDHYGVESKEIDLNRFNDANETTTRFSIN